MAARVYDPDHTAHIRHWLRQTALRGATGLAIVACAAGAVSVIDIQADEGTVWLVRLVWYTIAVTAGLAVLTLLVALVGTRYSESVRCSCTRRRPYSGLLMPGRSRSSSGLLSLCPAAAS